MVLWGCFCNNVFKLDHFHAAEEQEFSVSTKLLNLSGWKSLQNSIMGHLNTRDTGTHTKDIFLGLAAL